MATLAQRDHIREFGAWTNSDPVRSLIHYLQQRPENDVPFFGHGGEQRLANYFAAGGVLSLDCSAYQTLVFQMAGCADPTGNNYNGYGNSDSMLALAWPGYTQAASAQIGALVVFGTFGATAAESHTVHVACVYEPDAVDPILLSHGSAAGPSFVPLSDFASLGNHRFLSVTKL